ncbi:hypothetical protein PE066_02425 [Ramlibacter tataouinensis]|uniref:hypothetical protein n=1 Tax=Ramlibacter tataouinensis TaxID=94132 RepID=UPI0022F3973B|nr:hypothetical protein [Ramlibacter tataouinensis]WBY02410.1 hypothetical protein PE066_02425 [Ramlibacter tataouinensis]
MLIRRLALFGLAAIVSHALAADRQEAFRLYDLALRHEFAREYKEARAQFEASLASARAAGLGPSFESAATYNLARMVGYTCDFERANELLLEALELEQGLPRPNPGNLTKRVSELARLSFDRGQFAESATYYEQVIPELVRLGVLRQDPIGFAALLDDYALAESRAGNEASAQEARARSASIRSENPGKNAQFVPVHYREACPQAKSSNMTVDTDVLTAGFRQPIARRSLPR